MRKMKKLLLVALGVLTIVSGAFGMISCKNKDKDTNTAENEIREVYNLYVEDAESQGKTPLTYEMWLLSIKGDKGDKGRDGLTPYIGENGNWWLGDTDLGVNASGEKGDKGEKGEDGEKGETGHQGAQGVGIEKVECDENGNLVIILTNGVAQTVVISDIGTHKHKWTERIVLKEATVDVKGLIVQICDCGEMEIIAKCASRGLVYTLRDRASYSVTGIGECTDTDIVIPAMYEGLPVTTIGDYAFSSCDSLTSVVIPDSVTTIGERAFYDCDSLTSVAIPDGVTTIGDYAFYNCDSLTSVVIPDSVTTIGERAFYNCDSLTSVVIPDSVTSIGFYAFYNCSSLTSVVIGDSVTSIDYGAFAYCSSLTSVVIGDSVTKIDARAFSWCSRLTSVVIGDSVTSIGDYAFEYCNSLTTVYYKGTASDWSNMSIGSSNYELTSAKRYYYSETEQSGCWHYDESGNVALW